jgi:hypothetical protein
VSAATFSDLAYFLISGTVYVFRFQMSNLTLVNTVPMLQNCFSFTPRIRVVNGRLGLICKNKIDFFDISGPVLNFNRTISSLNTIFDVSELNQTAFIVLEDSALYVYTESGFTSFSIAPVPCLSFSLLLNLLPSLTAFFRHSNLSY